GAFMAARQLDALAFLIRGHHGGLISLADLKRWLREKSQDSRAEETLQIARRELSQVEPADLLTLPAGLNSPLTLDVFLRMLFSALVDADFLDTERHFRPGQS